ncbi:putative small secreted protein [Natronobacillus azotifigens]|uniref:PepSY domain-containing protein n=1 Tax=Natronobacillus azotifigens TaxID=472978 RepID=A0A9J6RDH5_9BACI|nr:PepSY domain-containing protein [Natronobacillus azotifigens]MCZ0703249.1 PepSY domain-containing protein [Natronobacillus azotifigens]
MNWKKLLFAGGIGAVIGYSVKAQLDNLPIRPEEALKQVKNAFRERGPVSGSWIYMKPEELTYNELDYTVYRGGITRTIDNVNTQYEFFIDAYTGSVIAVEETSSI